MPSSRGIGPSDRAMVATAVLAAVFFAVAAVASGPGGGLAERLGAVVSIRAAMGVTAAVLVTLALIAHEPVQLGAGLAVAGAANGVVQPAVNALLVGAVRPARRGLAFGIKQSGVPASTLLGGLAVPTLAVTWGWRPAFAAGAAVALTAAVVVHGQGPALRTQAAAASRVLSARLLTVAVATGLGSASASVLGVFTVASAVSGDVAPSTAGLLLTLGSLTAIAVRVTLGWVTDRAGGGFGTVAAMLAAGSVGYCLLAASGALWLGLGVFVAFSLGWGWNGVLNFAVADSHAGRPAAATGITQAGVYAGGTAGPAAFGAAAEVFGFPPAWLGTAAVSLLAAALMFVGHRQATSPRATSPRRRGRRS